MRHSIAATPSPCRARLSFGASCNGQTENMVVPVQNAKCDPFWGATIRKSFGRQMFYGHVINIDADVQTGARAYHVVYEDGDEEHLGDHEVRNCLVCRRGSVPVSTRSSIASLSGAPTPRTPTPAPYAGHSEWMMSHVENNGGVQGWQNYGEANSATCTAPASFYAFGPCGVFVVVAFAALALAWDMPSWSRTPAAATVAAPHVHGHVVSQTTPTPQQLEIAVEAIASTPLHMHANSAQKDITTTAMADDFVPPPPPWMHEVAAMPKAQAAPAQVDPFDPWAAERILSPTLPKKPLHDDAILAEDNSIATHTPPIPPWNLLDATPIVKSPEEPAPSLTLGDWLHTVHIDGDLAMKAATIAGEAMLTASKSLGAILAYDWQVAASVGDEQLFWIALSVLIILVISAMCRTRPLMANPIATSCDMPVNASIIESDGSTVEESPFLYGTPPGARQDSFMPQPMSSASLGLDLQASFAPMDFKAEPAVVKSECYELPGPMENSAILSSLAMWPAQPPTPAGSIHPTEGPSRAIAPSPLDKRILPSPSMKRVGPSPSPSWGPSPSPVLTKEPTHIPGITSPQVQPRRPKDSISPGIGNHQMRSPASIKAPKVKSPGSITAQQSKTRRSGGPILPSPQMVDGPRFRYTNSLKKIKEIYPNANDAESRNALTRHRGMLMPSIQDLEAKGWLNGSA